MALSSQIHIYGVDTDDFYTPQEAKYSRIRLRYLKYKTILKNIKENISKEKIDKYNKIYEKVNEKTKEYKGLLKKEMKSNQNIVRKLNPEKLIDKKIISIFESTLTRTIGLQKDDFTTDIFVVQTYYFEVMEQLIKNGFTYNDENYRYFSSSAGQIRTKKAVFIKEEKWNKYEKALMCGLTIDKINELGGINVNKFLAYLALSNSATDLWEDFDIDKCIVVDDFETEVIGEVDYICDTTYKIERRIMPVPITHTDGCGMILPKLSRKNFMIRLPWIKGLLSPFNYVKFIKENNCSPIIKDIYGKEWNVIEDDIQIIFTKSQFKMYKYYKDWNEYKDYFKKYKCQAGICNLEEDYFSNATINYQMLQTLTNVKDNEFEQIIKKSKERLNNLTKKDIMLQVFGVVDSNVNKTYLQQALEIYPELLQDEHCKHILMQIKNSLVKKYKTGKLNINGKYTFVIPDLYAFCEYLFGNIKIPNGLLKNGEVYCKLFKTANKLDCLRSPHLFAEHAIRKNVIDSEKSKWFITNGIYSSTFDLISKILQFDVDGDKFLVVADECFINVAERNMKNYDVVPLYYEMKKAKDVKLTYDSIWDGLKAAFSGGNIGFYSDNISKIWNSDVFINGTSDEKKEALDVIKLLCMENNFIIDYAKTLYKPTRPDDIDKIIKKYTKLKPPYFFRYLRDKKKYGVKKKIKVAKCNNSFVNRLSKEFKNSKLKFDTKSFGKLDYRKMMCFNDIEIDEEVINAYNLLNRQYHFKLSPNNKNIQYLITEIRKCLLSFDYNEFEISDMLVKYSFGVKKQKYKELLWQCFGHVIVGNLKNNIPENSIMCNKCGKRFIPNYPNRKLCDKCNKYQPIGTKTIICIDCGKEVEVDALSRKIRCEECYKLERQRINREYYNKNKK